MRHTVLAAAISLAGMGTAVAGEGMWVPQQLPEIAGPLKKAGLELSAKQLSDLTGDPLGAVVSLGGCTAGFVSPQGLVATNHHCAYGAIQLNSTPEKNLIRDGFYAATPGDELSAGPNARIYVLDAITDVTDQFKAAIAAAPDALARTKAADALEKKLVADCEAEAGFRCRVYSFSGGNVYRLFRNLEIKDVRLSYAPPSSVGKYGGDVDNWMWPRHTGDFSFYRAYVGKDGKPAAFSPDNVPYQPKHWLKLADKPLGEGDFVMVAGYPGRTARYALATEFDDTAGWTYPTVGKHYKNTIAMIEAAGKKNPDIAVKYAATLASLNNTMKNYEGQLDGFKRIGAAETKRKEEAAVLAWLRTQGDAGKAGLDAHAKLVELGDIARATRERDLVFGSLRGTGVLGAASQLYRLSIEKAKPDAEREQGYQQRDMPALEGGMKQMERRYHPDMDRELQQYWLREYVKLPQAQRVAAVDKWLGGNDEKAIQRALDNLAKSELRNADKRMALIGSDRAAFEASQDPAIQFAVAVMPTVLQLEETAKTRAGDSLLARPAYLQAIADYKKSKGEFVYPDANSSLRITFGNVTGYTKLDGSKQKPFTLLEEIPAKDTGVDPFDAPKVQLEAIAAKRYSGLADKRLGTVTVNFLSNLDITGGNSGSPVLDAQGKLVGLAFDGNWESVSSNWVFDPVMTRMIAVDQRYMRWIMREVFPAPALLKEMNVAPKGK
ncbi:S46 family peptidase [Aerolutibacter ruishenii]|uniref:Dipeptidyl-peptidase n=1 Tax=Aerolutibacter ruishenii TaxID=686800 RepID=A0A562LKK2_9GAMM|nr:S46 family peptidase [Lysobacter ruishenii]TWI08160.1 peptidase S46-like protein [Lysobacter ruishenii]